MELTNGTFKRVLRSPLLILSAAVFGLSYSYVDNINPIPGVVKGFLGLGGDLLGTVITAISAILSLGSLVKILILLIIFVLAGAFIIGFFMSGYINTLKTAIITGKADNKEFLKGIKANFGRSMKSAFIQIITSLLMFIVTIVAALPALSTMWSALNGNSKMLPLAVFISLISIFAIFFVLLFYIVYVVFWYPAISLGYINFISASKRIIDNSFFEISGKVLAYTFEFILITAVSIFIRSFLKYAFQNIIFSAGFIALEGVLVTLWFLSYTSYVFSEFIVLTKKYNFNNSSPK